MSVEYCNDNVYGNVYAHTAYVSGYGDVYGFVYVFGSTHPRGRQPIAVDQPEGGGSDYPFVSPSYDIQRLLGDLFLSFDDPSDEVVFPLRVAWMAGFGVSVVPEIGGYPSQVNSRDMLIVDANDRVVFDSTTAEKFTTSVWDCRMLIIEWTTETNGVLRCVQHTSWSASDVAAGLSREYDSYIVPENGQIIAECIYKLPKRVTSLQVGLATIRDSSVSFVAGYNVTLTQPETVSPIDGGSVELGLSSAQKTVLPGERLATQIQLDAEPGTGLGAFPGCVDTSGDVKTINRIPAGGFQNFTIDAAGCIRLQRAVSLTSEEPREFGYGSLALSSSESRATIELHNNCKPCCECESYARTYQGLKRQWFAYRAIGETAEGIRDTFRNNINRWEIQKQIREADTIRVLLQSEGDCKLSWGLSHCNASKCCIVNVRAIMTWLYYINGELQPPTAASFDCQKTKIDGSAQCDGAEPLLLSQPGISNDGRVFSAEWDYSNPQSVTSLQGRICFPDCRALSPEDLKIRLHVVVVWSASVNDPSTDLPCPYQTIEYESLPEDVKTTWADNGFSLPGTAIRANKLSPVLSVVKDSRFCSSCPCEDESVE